MASNEKMIEVKNLTKMYGTIRALDAVSFQVSRGEILGFLGPNGAGKTTTMKILTCFLAPTKGSCKVAGIDIYEDTLEIRRKVGYLPENAPLYTDMQVSEYLHFVGEVRGIAGQDRAKAADKVIDTCGLKDVTRREIRNLSKGFRQRVGLAQAMIHNPEILILDEPTSGLDPNQIVEIRELIKSIGKERTVVLSTHNLAEVQASTHRVVIVHNGRLVADGTIDELESARGGAHYDVTLQSPAADGNGKPDVASAFGDTPGVRDAKQLESQSPEEISLLVRGDGDKDLRADIFRKAVDNQWVLLGLQHKQVNLEAIFRRLTTETRADQAATN